MKEADRWFSKKVRYIDTEGDHGHWYNRCCTCGKTYPVKKLQAGHYWGRANMATRYNLWNVHPQCVGCNIFKEGNKPEYTLYLIRKYGEDILLTLESLKNCYVKLTEKDFELIIKESKKFCKKYE